MVLFKDEVKKDKVVLKLVISSRSVAVSEKMGSNNDPLGCIAKSNDGFILIVRNKPNDQADTSAFMLSLELIKRVITCPEETTLVINSSEFKSKKELERFKSVIAYVFMDDDIDIVINMDKEDREEFSI